MKKGSPVGKILAIGLGILALIVVGAILLIGGLLYVMWASGQQAGK